ncbi:hypothetical protein EUGRSUZ_C02485 [Eucalyptus grandis]|uniref:Uncharacterized protein n=2 Tax=Eucalyptus grandis TaxID=71139 RepID=A0ACC3LGI5_EUCGR|nr:hypothetical protein EUGRSUZ_C02485 [Eucalyptus grandis]
MKVVQWLLPVAVAWWLRQGGAPTVAGECATKCGDVDVSYPFGLELECARSQEFFLNCTTERNHTQLLLGDCPIRNMSVEDATMVISLPEVYTCYDPDGQVNYLNGTIDLTSFPPYRFSYTRNKLTVLGCNTYAVTSDPNGTFGTGCLSYCSQPIDFANETNCSGLGCCQTSIPKGLKMLDININLLDEEDKEACGLAFVVDDRSFNMSNRNSRPGRKKASLNQSGYACGNNTDCHDYVNGLGYRCLCSLGTTGIPIIAPTVVKSLVGEEDIGDEFLGSCRSK